ncbi:MAG: sugar phosphate isomerase/epimerase, partial [Clostridia bacterium]
ISITQENVSWCASANPQYLRRLREELGDKIGFTFDLKQACRANVPFEEYLSAMGNRIMNIHISDFSTDNTCLLPGNGTLDFNYFFKCLREYSYDGPLIIETYSSAFDNIRQIESSKLWLEHQMVGF